MPLPSPEDVNFLAMIRSNVDRFICAVAARYAPEAGAKQRLLDIAPQDHAGARPFFPARVKVETLDIDPKSGATFIADICEDNAALIPPETYNFVVCTEVLEHTLRPFDAVREIHRVLKKGGRLFLTVPLNFRIHGPLPDCWRFTEHGLRAILDGFNVVEINPLETPGRPLMPVHYTVIAERK